jgi:hypothetical protein
MNLKEQIIVLEEAGKALKTALNLCQTKDQIIDYLIREVNEYESLVAGEAITTRDNVEEAMR